MFFWKRNVEVALWLFVWNMFFKGCFRVDVLAKGFSIVVRSVVLLEVEFRGLFGGLCLGELEVRGLFAIASGSRPLSNGFSSNYRPASGARCPIY